MFSLPQPFRLRSIDAADQDFIDALYCSTRDDLVAMAVDETFLAQLIRMQQHTHAQGMRSAFPQSQYFLLERNGAAIGRLVVDTHGDRVHLVELALCPASRNQGAGSVVLGTLQAMAAQRDVPLTLNVGLANLAARRLYTKLGFVGIGADAVQESMQWSACASRAPAPISHCTANPDLINTD